MKLKRSERLVDMTQRLLDNPHTLISLTTFTALYQSAKSSISEDIAIIKKTFEKQGVGIIRTVPGAAGGVIFVPKIKREQALAAAEKLREQMNDASRLLPGGYIYLSDLLAKPDVLHDLWKMIESAYEDKKIDAVMTVATKGVPIAQTVANYLNVSFNFVEGESLMMSLKDAAVSSGSACTSATLEPSYVLRALGLSDELAHSSIRFSFGKYTTEADIDHVLTVTRSAVEKLRELSPLWDMYKDGIDLSTVEWAEH